MNKTGIAVVSAAVLLAGCSKKQMKTDVSVIDYSDRDPVEVIYELMESYAETVESQREADPEISAITLNNYPEVFRDPENPFFSQLEDLDGNGYKELVLGVTVEGVNRIYDMKTVDAEGTMTNLFLTENGSYMVKEGTVYAVYPESGEIAGEESDVYGAYIFNDGVLVKIN